VRYDLMAVIGVLVAMWAICLGCGLAVERAVRVRLSNALLLPLGLCVSLVLILPGYAAGAGDALAIALLAAVALAGLIFARDGLRARLNPGCAGLAGLAVYVVYMLPVIASGHWTWSGYDFVNDTSFEMLLAEHVKGFGAAVGNIPETSAREFLRSYLDSGYPLGTQSLLGTLSGLTYTPVAVLYQGLIAGFAATSAVALTEIARHRLDPLLAALVGFVALCANLTYQYALQGGIKEIGLLATLCSAAALARAAMAQKRPYAGALLVAIAGAAALAAYNALAIPFMGSLVLCVGVGMLANRVRPTRAWLAPVVLGVSVMGLLAIPSLVSLQTFFHVAQAGQSSTGVGATQLGQLLRPLPLSQVSGVWLAGEYRLPVIPQPAATLTVIASAAVLVLALVTVPWALSRRDPAPLLVLGMMGLTLLVLHPRVSPYAQGKLLALASPAVVFASLYGLAAVRRRVAAGAMVIVAGLAVAIWGSDLLAYGHNRVAPTGRMNAISQVGSRFSSQGPVLWNEFEEFAKYFARSARISVPFEALTPQQVQLRHPTYFFGHYFDLDEELLPFVEGYPLIAMRRSPSASRPPANYRLAYANRYYLVWRRGPRPQVLRHLPEQQLYSSSARASCAAVRRLVENAPANSELIVAKPPELAWFEPLYARDRSFGWGLVPGQRGAVVPNTPGHASGTLMVEGVGRYALWLQGDFPGPISVSLDGRAVGTASGSNTPGQWLQVAARQALARGRHAIRLARPGGHRHFGPGEWRVGVIGAPALQREAPERLSTLPVANWRELCGARVDWIELGRP
jgi:hypothetical protein